MRQTTKATWCDTKTRSWWGTWMWCMGERNHPGDHIFDPSHPGGYWAEGD